jgi:type I restriction enzyme M protein
MALTSEELNKFWDMAEMLRNNVDPSEYKHIVLGLVFLKHVSDSFDERRVELQREFDDPKSDSYKPNSQAKLNALESRDYYTEVNVFWVPEKSRWKSIAENARQSDIAIRIDEALYQIERENPKLEGIVERSYASTKLPVSALGGVVDMISSLNFTASKNSSEDVLGQVYEYFLGKFSSEEGKKAGAFYTAPSIVRTIVEVIQPLQGRIYDPACGSGGMFVQSEKFVEAHGGKLGQIAIYGQESNPTTRRLCAMNLAIRGIDFDLGKSHGDTFTENQHADLRFDFILMNPPFGRKASYPRAQLLDDVRWKKYGVPREKPANYAWLSHAAHHLAPSGRAGIVMPRGALTSTQGGDDAIRTAMLDDDLIECVVDLPSQLFFNVQIPACLWFFNKDKKRWKNSRSGQVLFIDARNLGTAISKTQIIFNDEEISKIASTFKAWADGDYVDVDGFCKTVSRDEIRSSRDSLSPGRYINNEVEEFEEDEDFTERMQSLSEELSSLTKTSQQLQQRIDKSLKLFGFGDL